MVTRTALLIDVDYAIREGKTKVRLLMKGKKKMFRLYDDYEPYFYIDAPSSKIKEIEKTSAHFRGSAAKIVRVEEKEILSGVHKKKLLKVFAQHPFHVPALREALKHYDAYEHRIPFGKRYMIDKGLAPFTLVTYEREGQQIKKILKVRESGPVKLRTLAFDIETYNPHGAPRPELDPVIMVSYADEKSGVFTYKETGKKFAHELKGEKEVIEAFCELVKKNDVELLLGYNSASFDLPYLKKRAEVLGTKLPLGRDGSEFRKMQRGIREVVKVSGRLHIDLYPVVRFLGAIGALKVSKFTLENAYEEITGKKKHMVKRLEIWQMWDKRAEREELAEYSLHDAEVTLEIGGVVLPLEIEMSRLTKTPLFDVCNSSTGQLVESLLMYRSYEHGMLIPNRPDEGEVKKREANPIQGAFVKLPSPGIYDNMVVFDFRGLYPSIIMAHNIDPYTLNCDCCKGDGHKSPTGARFCKKKKGLVPTVLGELIGKRAELKDKLKGVKRESEEHSILFARTQALKILNNSFYGYLAYARSRWYSREAGESVTAWGRQYIQDTIAKAEKEGFEVLYGDSLPPERKIIIKDENGGISIVPIGQFVESCGTSQSASKFQTLAFDGKKVVFAPIKRAIAHHYPKEKGGLLEIITKYGRTIVTPQHSVYKYENGVKLADAKELKVGDSLISLTNAPSSGIYGEGHAFDISKLDFGQIRNEIFLYSDNLQFPQKKGVCPYCGKESVLSRHVFANHKERRVRLVNDRGSLFSFLGMKNAKGGRVPRYWKLTKELAWLWGYYAAEGSASERSAVHRKEMISFGSQDSKTIEKVKGILEGITGENLAIIEDFDRRISKNMYYYRVQRSVIAALFIYGFGLGKKSSGKRVPEFILSATEELKKAFLEGYFEGDGVKYHDPRYATHFQKISTKSPELAVGIQYLFKTIAIREENSFGKRIEHVYWSFRKDKPGIVDLRFQAVKGREFDNFCLAGIKEVRKIDYEGPVYDLEVEGAHNFVDAEGLILVHNTDSIFLLVGGKKKEDALSFMKKINSELPETMELELEGFYPRGVFVTKKGDAKGAKKKYALIGEDGRIKIRGFELVRRDWSEAAKKTQRAVLSAILKEGSKEKAVAVVKEMVLALKDGKVPLEELVIYSTMRKDPSKYDIISPEIEAAKKAIKRGMKLGTGSMIGYVITKSGNSISDKAEVAEYAKDYDANYYIEHQILPSVMKILKELGVSEDDLKFKGTQKGLDGFF